MALLHRTWQTIVVSLDIVLVDTVEHDEMLDGLVFGEDGDEWGETTQAILDSESEVDDNDNEQ